MEKKRILIACSCLDYMLINKILGGFCSLDKAENREEIIRFGNQSHYDLLLIDIAFLKPDFEILKTIKKEGIPVVALSPEPFDARNKKMMEAGCCACYVKPIRTDLFAAFISFWIQEYSEKGKEA